MNLRLDKDKKKTGKRVKSNNTMCINCGKCLNSGLCMVPWPGFSDAGKKKAGSSLHEFDITNVNKDK